MYGTGIGSLTVLLKTKDRVRVQWTAQGTEGPQWRFQQMVLNLEDNTQVRKAVFLYCSPDFPSCLDHLSSIGWAT